MRVSQESARERERNKCNIRSCSWECERGESGFQVQLFRVGYKTGPNLKTNQQSPLFASQPKIFPPLLKNISIGAKKMKSFVALVALVGIALAAPQDPEIAVRAPSSFQNCDCQCNSYQSTMGEISQGG